MNYYNLGKRIKSCRTKQHLTQAYVAEIIGITPQHLSHIESGKTKPSLECIVNIANCLNVSIDSLLCDSINNSKEYHMGELSKIIKNYTTQDMRSLVKLSYTFSEIIKDYRKEN